MYTFRVTCPNYKMNFYYSLPHMQTRASRLKIEREWKNTHVNSDYASDFVARVIS